MTNVIVPAVFLAASGINPIVAGSKVVEELTKVVEGLTKVVGELAKDCHVFFPDPHSEAGRLFHSRTSGRVSLYENSAQ